MLQREEKKFGTWWYNDRCFLYQEKTEKDRYRVVGDWHKRGMNDMERRRRSGGKT